MVQRKDYLISALIGILTGILALRIFSFLKINFEFQTYLLLFGIPVIFVLGVYLGKFLSQKLSAPFLEQFGKFTAVGFLNSLIDFSILNSISFVTGITAGFSVGWINIPGFLVATTNSYLWNKYWVFAAHDGLLHDFPKFLAVTTVGLFINSSMVIVFTTFLNFGIDPAIWLNISKTAATATALIWNFIGYKFVAFKNHV